MPPSLTHRNLTKKKMRAVTKDALPNVAGATNEFLQPVIEILNTLPRAAMAKLTQLYAMAMTEQNQAFAQQYYTAMKALLDKYELWDLLAALAVPTVLLFLLRYNLVYWLSWVVTLVQAGPVLALVGVALLMYYQSKNSSLLGALTTVGSFGSSAARTGLGCLHTFLTRSGGSG